MSPRDRLCRRVGLERDMRQQGFSIRGASRLTRYARESATSLLKNASSWLIGRMDLTAALSGSLVAGWSTSKQVVKTVWWRCSICFSDCSICALYQQLPAPESSICMEAHIVYASIGAVLVNAHVHLLCRVSGG